MKGSLIKIKNSVRARLQRGVICEHEVDRIWIITSWNWWRHNHTMPFWKAVRWTFMTDVWDKVENIYCGIWLQTRGRYLHWKVEKQKAEMWKRIKEKSK